MSFVPFQILLSKLYFSCQNVRLHVDTRNVKIHKNLLSIMSKYFSGMSKCQKKTPQISKPLPPSPKETPIKPSLLILTNAKDNEIIDLIYNHASLIPCCF